MLLRKLLEICLSLYLF